MIGNGRLLCVLFVFGAACAARGQDALDRITVPGASASTARRLSAADRLAADKEWREAIDEYQRIIDEVGNDLVAIDKGRMVSARRLCQLRIAGLPDNARQIYRNKVNARAARWLEQADKDHDPRYLLKIVDEAFGSAACAAALDRLGDLAFEQGDFDSAAHWWRQLQPAPKDGPDAGTLRVQDSELDPARVDAKLLLARIFRDERNLDDALAAYAKAHADSAGMLAGEKGKYVDILRKLAAPAARSARARTSSAWPTFAGDFQRGRRLPSVPLRLDRLPLFEPAAWTWNLEHSAKPEKREPGSVEPVPPSVQARQLAFHPAIAGDIVVCADARRVGFHNLVSGAVQYWDLVDDGKLLLAKQELGLPAPAGLAYTVTIAGDRVYVRLGTQQIRPHGENPQKGDLESYLVCLRLHTGPDENRLVWLRHARVPAHPDSFFEGAPVVYDGRVLTALSRFDGGNVVSSIACYDADTGVPCFQKPIDVSSVHDFHGDQARWRHRLLTLAGGQVVYCSHSGVISALDAVSGQRRWARRYASRKTTPRSSNDLAPCLFAADRLLVAPNDYNRILCLDPFNGMLHWESEPTVEVVQMLGVAHGRLIFTTPRDIRALALGDGHTVRNWIQPRDGVKLPTFGRGLLAGDVVLWPTLHGLRVLDQKTGRIRPLPLNTHANRLHGNLAAAAGCLVIADATRLHAYVAPGRFLERRRKEMGAGPTPRKRFRLALAQADAGLLDEALANLIQIERNTPADALWQEVPLARLARSHRHELLLLHADDAGSAGRFARAAGLLEQASAVEFAPPQRAAALARLGTLWSEQKPDFALAAWQRLLADPLLRQTTLTADNGPPRQARAIASINIARLLHDHGPTLRASYEKQADELLERGQLEEVAVQFRHARAARSALEQLAARHEKAARPGAAAEAYRRLLRRELSTEKKKAIEQALAARLARFEPEREQSDGLLRRGWHVELAESERLLPIENPGDQVFTIRTRADGVDLICRDLDGGKRLWSRTLARTPIWLGRFQNRVIVADVEEIQLLQLEDGAPILRIRPPFSSVFGQSAKLGRFSLNEDRLIFVVDDRILACLDVNTDQLLWWRPAPNAYLGLPGADGAFGPHFLAHGDRLLAQTARGQRWLLDARTGAFVLDDPKPGPLWPAPPALLDKWIALVVGNQQRVDAVDLKTGGIVWTHDMVKPTVTGRLPFVAVAGGAVFVVSDAWQLERLEADGGKALWLFGSSRWLDDEDAQPDLVIAGERVALVRNRILTMLALKDATPGPEHAFDLPADSWRMRRHGAGLLVYPEPASLAGDVYVGPVRPSSKLFSLFLFSAIGQLQQRLNFEVLAPPGLQFTPGGLVVDDGKRLWRIHGRR